jgi:hypothetical protein
MIRIKSPKGRYPPTKEATAPIELGEKIVAAPLATIWS